MTGLGNKIKLVGMAYLWTFIVQSTKGIGQMINSMEKEQRPGENQEDLKLSTLVGSSKAKRMERGGFNGKMGHIMKETLQMGTSKGLGDTILQTWISTMRENLG